MNKVLLTGSSGFIGENILEKLNELGIPVDCFGRTKPRKNCNYFYEGDFNTLSTYEQIFLNIDTVIHCAALTSMTTSTDHGILNDYRLVNVKGTLDLATAALRSGVKRFIFLSSIKVNGEMNFLGNKFFYNDPPSPEDYYGLTKNEAEMELIKLTKNSGMNFVIIRPPLVYGHGVKGNFRTLINLVKGKKFLPLGAINNKRSMVGIDNLVDLIITCINHPKASNEIFLVSDDEDMSTTELVKKISLTLGICPILVPIPNKLIQTLATLGGKKDLAKRLCGSLVVDIEHTKKTLNWLPPYRVEEQIQKMFNMEK